MFTRLKSASLLMMLALLGSLFLTAFPKTASAAVSSAASPTVIAGGLAFGRYIVVNGDGTYYVTEAGFGAPSGGGALNGKVTKIAADGTKTPVVSNLPSYGAVGPAGIVSAGGFLWVSVGGAAQDAGLTPLPNENYVVKINPTTGAVTPVANIGAYELANNPDGDVKEDGSPDTNSNLYGLALGADGKLYAADAGGNTVYKVDPATSNLNLFKVVPRVTVPPLPFPTPPTAQAVPTGIAAGKDGSIYVGLLGGLLPGAGKVIKIAPNGTISDYGTGLNAVIGVAVGPDGNVYASEFYKELDFSGGGEESSFVGGRIVRLLPGGTKEVLDDTISNPAGLAFDKAGNLYAIIDGLTPNSKLVRYNNIAPAKIVCGRPALSQLSESKLVDTSGNSEGLANLVDGADYTFWRVTDYPKAVALEIRYNEPTTVTAIKLFSQVPTKAPNVYFQYEDSTGKWSDIPGLSGVDAASSYGQRTFNVPEISSKKFRIVLDNTTYLYDVGYFGDLQVCTSTLPLFVSGPQSPTSHRLNVASASASGGNASNVLDGLPWTDWVVGGNPDTATLELNLGSTKTVTSLKDFNTSGAVASKTTVQYWNGSSWVNIPGLVNINTGNYGPYGLQSLPSFTPITTTRLRFVVDNTSARAWNVGGYGDIQVFGY